MLIKIINDRIEKYPYTYDEFIKDNSNVSFQENFMGDKDTLKLFNTYNVVSMDKPLCNSFQRVVEVEPIKKGDEYEQTWKIFNLTSEEIIDKKSLLISHAINRKDEILNNISNTTVDETATNRELCTSQVNAKCEEIIAAIENDSDGIFNEDVINGYLSSPELINYLP